MTLGEAFLLNPTVYLPRGTEAPFVDMAALQPFTRDVVSNTTKPYTGGMKFRDGDVLMARITPSLENGKTAIFRAPSGDSGPAFGSTEFIVIRGRDGLSDSTYAYYLFTSPAVRDHAIASMNGSSGRQRVQHDSLASFKINLPALPEQRAIAATLGALDDKIESNQRQRRILRSLGAALVSEALASGGVRRPLNAVTASIARGMTPKYTDHDLAAPLVLNQKCIRDGWASLALARRTQDRVVAPAKKASSGDILVNSTGVGTLGRVARWHEGSIFVDSHITVVRPDPAEVGPVTLGYVLLALQPDIEALGEGSTGQTELSPTRLGNFQVLVPSDTRMGDLEHDLLALERRAALLATENDRLAALRDVLLPALVSGRVRFSVEEAA
ncbi:hypothetical protein GCM10027411_07330 [Microbacterium aureliae]